MKLKLWKIEDWLFFNHADNIVEEGAYDYYSIEKSIKIFRWKIALDVRYNDYRSRGSFDCWPWGFVIYVNHWFFMVNIIKETL